jgi:hypothetical protein
MLMNVRTLDEMATFPTHSIITSSRVLQEVDDLGRFES